MPTEPLKALDVRGLRAQVHGNPEAGFCAWLAQRPVLIGSTRAALMLVRGAIAAPLQLLQVLQGQVSLLHARAEGAFLIVQAPWEQRERLEILLVDMMDLDSVPAPVPQIDGTSSELGPPTTTGFGVSHPPDGGPRYSQTDDGHRAKMVLAHLGSWKPGILAIGTKKWKLPNDMVIHETRLLRQVTWTLEFGRQAVEPFWNMADRIKPPLAMAFASNQEAEGAEDQGQTLIETVRISAPVGSQDARRTLAALVYDVLQAGWYEEQRALVTQLEPEVASR